MIIPEVSNIVFALLILCIAWLASTIVVAALKRSRVLTKKTETTFDDTFLQLIRRPLHLGFQLAGIVIALEYLFPNFQYEGYSYGELSVILLIVWGAYVMNRLIRGFMHWKEEEAQKEQGGGVRRGTFGFLNTIVSILVWGVAFTFVLNQLGVDVTALIAGLGIAGVAVALALQNTLSGLFSAVGLALDRPIRQGDFVRLENGTEGFVEDISMRSTRIRTFENSLVVVPNSTLANMILVNTFLPEQETSLSIPLTVGYNEDLDRVEKIVLEVAEHVLDQHEAKGSVPSFVRYKNFGDSAIELTAFLRISRFLDQYVIRHDFIKTVHKRFKKEQIEIPFPQMDIHLQK